LVAITNVHDGRILAFAVRDEASFSLTVGGVSREGCQSVIDVRVRSSTSEEKRR
jgi:hypothetical protein